MAKAVLTTKIDPTYDDLPEQRYHFPRTYLRQIEAALGDFIVYYEPRRASGDLSSRGGRQAYFATARVATIVPDPARPDHFYARMDSYLDFPHAVGFRAEGVHYESVTQRPDKQTSKGAFGRAVRTLPDREYETIMQAAFAPILAGIDQVRNAARPTLRGLAEEQATFERPIVERVMARPFRDAAFSGVIKGAYADTCAFTGLKIINGGGRSEVQAAHIVPVASGGQDSMRNGIALCGTVHWMFDRGLISITDDHQLLLARNEIPDQILRLLNPNRRLLSPIQPQAAPHSHFLRWHREHVFKG